MFEIAAVELWSQPAVQLVEQGWEPFSVSDGTLWLRRYKPEEPKTWCIIHIQEEGKITLANINAGTSQSLQPRKLGTRAEATRARDFLKGCFPDDDYRAINIEDGLKG